MAQILSFDCINERISSITLPVDQPLNGPYLQEVPMFSSFVDGWQRLLANAGMYSSTTFHFDAFWDANEARMAVDMLLNTAPDVRLEFQTLGTDETSPPPDGLYYNNVAFADTNLTFCVRVVFERTAALEWPYRSVSFEAVDVRPQVGDLEEYGLDQADAAGVQMVIDPKHVTMVSGKNTVAIT